MIGENIDNRRILEYEAAARVNIADRTLRDLLNLPGTVETSTHTLSYLYAADGTKLMKSVSPTGSGGPYETELQYAGNLVFRVLDLEAILVEGGYIDMTGTTPVYRFYVTDHQGNIRAVTDGTGTVLRTNHYDPYGEEVLPVLTSASTLPASTAGTNAASRYMYGAKEWDNSVSLYDFSARWYNPAGAVSFTTMDPLCEKYYGISPYAYCAGNPVNLVDPLGLEGTKHVEDDGTMIIESNVLVLLKNEIPFSDDMTEKQKRKVEKKNNQIRERNAFRLNSITNALKSEFGNTTDEDGNVVKFQFNVIPLQVEDTSPQYSNVIDLSVEYGLPAETPDRLGKGSGVAAASVFTEGSTSHLGEAIGGIEVRLSSYSSQTIAHEVGHTLKLSHSKERGGNSGLMHYPPERLASKEVSQIIRMAYAKRN